MKTRSTRNKQSKEVFLFQMNLPDNHKSHSTIGAIEELIAHIGCLKAKHFHVRSQSREIRTFANLTKVQEDLFLMIKTILTSVGPLRKPFETIRVKELEEIIPKVDSKTDNKKMPPGLTVKDSDIYLAYTVCARAKRQLPNARDPKLGIAVEEDIVIYMKKLCEYFLALRVATFDMSELA
jgi:cob(I)alamin adenosyltransferase